APALLRAGELARRQRARASRPHDRRRRARAARAVSRSPRRRVRLGAARRGARARPFHQMDPAARRRKAAGRRAPQAAEGRLSHPARRSHAHGSARAAGRSSARRGLPHARLLRRRGARSAARAAPRRQAQSRRTAVDATEPGNLAPDVPPRLKKTLRWRLNRLRCMTPLELAHRTLRAMLARAEGKGLLGSPAMSAPDLGTSGKAWVHHDPGVDAADEIAHGRISVFALREVDLGVPPRWNRDPKTGIEAPLVYGKLLDYRNPDLVGDIKYLWEPNRHHELVTLAQAYALSRKRRYYDALVEQLESWFIACPYALGPNWASALEAGIRLANWAAAWQLVQPIADAEFKARWLRSVYQH